MTAPDDFDEDGLCYECDRQREEIEALYRFYYPTYDPAAEIRREDKGNAAINFGA